MIAERLTAQWLAGPPADDPVAVAERLLNIQAQDLRGAQLAIRARTEGLSVADVHRAPHGRSLAPDHVAQPRNAAPGPDARTSVAGPHTPQVRTANARALAAAGLSEDAAERRLRVVERALADEGPLPRSALRRRLEAASVPTVGGQRSPTS